MTSANIKKNCAFSFKRKRAAWNKRKDKTMALDTQVNLAESDKGSFYNRKEWLEEYEYGKGMFYSEYAVTSGRLLLYFRTNLLMLWYTEQLFLERPLYRCFLHNDHLLYFQ